MALKFKPYCLNLPAGVITDRTVLFDSERVLTGITANHVRAYRHNYNRRVKCAMCAIALDRSITSVHFPADIFQSSTKLNTWIMPVAYLCLPCYLNKILPDILPDNCVAHEAASHVRRLQEYDEDCVLRN